MIDHHKRATLISGLQILLICAFLTGCSSLGSEKMPNEPIASAAPDAIQSPTASLQETIPPPPVSSCSGATNKSLSSRQLPESSAALNSGALQVATPNPVQGLQNALELADSEMIAANASVSLQEARRHAEAVVNILVGYWGCWYGDANEDGKLEDPSDGYGVLPAGRIQEAAPDTPAAGIQLGWALEVYENSGQSDQKPIQTILGNVNLWQTNPSEAYAVIQSAVTSTSPNYVQVTKLQGNVDQAVAWARLILVKAQTLDEAQAFANNGLKETRAALRAIAPIE